VQKRAIGLTLRSSTTSLKGGQQMQGFAKWCPPTRGIKGGGIVARFAFYPIVTPIISKETLSSTKELIV
jgi:hypothetical protein